MINDPLKCNATGKRRYPTPGDAKNAIQKLQAFNRSKNRSKKAAGKSSLKRYYQCHLCKGFHLTSSEYKSKRSYTKKIDEFKKNTQGLIVTEEEALRWKKNSLPFPKN